MDRSLLLAHLAQAEHQVAQSERLIASQRAIVEGLEWGGIDTTEAEGLLRQFEATQALHIAERDRLRTQLKTLDASPPS